MLAGIRRGLVARTERDGASNSEPALCPVVRRFELQLADPIAVKRNDYFAAVKPVVPLDGVLPVPLKDVVAMPHRAVLLFDARPRIAESYVADPAPRDENRGVASPAN